MKTQLLRELRKNFIIRRDPCYTFDFIEIDSNGIESSPLKYRELRYAVMKQQARIRHTIWEKYPDWAKRMGITERDYEYFGVLGSGGTSGSNGSGTVSGNYRVKSL